MSYKFEGLRVWKMSLALTLEVSLLVKTFLKNELYVLSSQMKRAADSVSLNIAEGSTGQSDAEFRKFLGYSLRSLIEVVACLYIAKERHLICEMQFRILYESSEELTRSIQAFRKYLT